MLTFGSFSNDVGLIWARFASKVWVRKTVSWQVAAWQFWWMIFADCGGMVAGLASLVISSWLASGWLAGLSACWFGSLVCWLVSVLVRYAGSLASSWLASLLACWRSSMVCWFALACWRASLPVCFYAGWLVGSGNIQWSSITDTVLIE